MNKLVEKPLGDVRVLELSVWEAGPTCGTLLALLGAEVIKIEKPEGDPGRIAFMGDYELENNYPYCHYFANMNLNKRHVTLNLKTSEGKDLFKKLIQKSDVFIHNLTVKAAEDLDVTYDNVSKINPNIIYVSITGYGEESPYKYYPCYDTIAQAMGGIIYITGHPETPPARCGASIGDSAAALSAVIGILAALHQRKATGRGSKIEISMVDSIVGLLRAISTLYFGSHEIVERMGCAVRGITPHNVYKCKDGWVVIICYDPQQRLKCIELVCKEMGKNFEEYKPETLVAAKVKKEYIEKVDSLVNSWTSTKLKSEVFHKLSQNGIPCGIVYNIEELIRDQHVQSRKLFTNLKNEEGKEYTIITSHIKMSTCKVNPCLPPSKPGYHNEEVFSKILGLSKEEIEKLKSKKII